MCHVGYHNGVKCSKSTNGVVGRNMVIREGTSTPYPYPEWVSFSIRISHCPLLDGDGHFSPLYEASPDARLRQLYLIEISLVLPGLAKNPPWNTGWASSAWDIMQKGSPTLKNLKLLDMRQPAEIEQFFSFSLRSPGSSHFPAGKSRVINSE